MPTAAAGTLLVPIGHCLGGNYDPPGGGHSFGVRIGPELVRLDDTRFAVWALAHGTPDRAVDRSWDRAALVEAAHRAGVPTAAATVEALLAEHLLAEVADPVDFARRYRLVPLMLGLGNSADEPGLYSVGLIGQPIVTMSSTAYDLYQWAHLDPDLWVACEGAAETARRVGIEDLEATDPHRLLAGLLTNLHTLLAPNAVYLDTRRAA